MKNQVKKQILRTVAVGISACMAFQPVTVMAEGITETEPENTQEENTSEQTDEFAGRADEAEREIEEAIDAVAGTSEAETEEATEEEAEGTSEEEAEGTTEGTSEGAAEGTAEGASGSDATVPSSESDNNIPSEEQAKETQDNEETSSDAITKSNEAKEVVEAIDADETIGGDIDLTEETAKLDNAVQYLEDANKELKEAKEAVKEAKKANEVIISDIKNTNEKANDAIEVLVNGTVNKDENGDPAIAEDGMPELNNVDEYADAATDAGNAEDLFNESLTPADDATKEYKDVTEGATDYVNNNTALTDTTGEILSKLVSDAKEADGNLEKAEDKVAKAQADLDKAVKEKDSADKAYDEAKALYDEAVEAYNKSSFDTVAKYGKEAEDDGIDHLEDLSSNVIAAKRGVHNAQQYIRNDRELGNDAITSARKEMKQAEKNVNEKLKALQDARYEELVQLQKKYDEASDENKADAREVLAKKVIEYYGLADEEGTISDIKFDAAHAYTDDKDVVTVIDGKACYISGYNDDKSPVYTEIPTRQAVTFTVTRTVEKEDGTKEEVTETRVRTFEVSENDGKISVTEVAHSNVKDSDSAVVKRERTFTEVVPEHYEDSEGETVSLEKVVEKYETTDSNGNKTMHVLDPNNETILSQTGKKLEGANVKVVSESQFEYKENLSGGSDSAEGSSTPGFYKVTTDNYTKTERTTVGGNYKGSENSATSSMNDAVSAKKRALGIAADESYKITGNEDGTVTKVEIFGFIDHHELSGSYFTWYYTVTTTTTSTVVTKANYGTKDYAFVPEYEKKDTRTYYEIGGYSNVESSALSNSVSAYATAMTYQKTAREALQTAQDAFDDTNEAYDKAKKEVDEARKAVEAMSNSGIYGQSMSSEWPQAFIDAKARLEEARLKLDEATKNKAAAKEALEKAELAKDKADSAVEAARAAKKTAYEALDKAAKSKKTADDEKAAEEEKKAEDDQSKKDDETGGKGDENPQTQEETEGTEEDPTDSNAGTDDKDKTPVAEDDTTSEDKQSDKDGEISGKGDKGSKDKGEANKEGANEEGANKEEKGSKDQDANRDEKEKAPVADADTNIEDEQTPSSFTPDENNARFIPSVDFETIVAGQTTSDDASASHVIKAANPGNTPSTAKTLLNPVTVAANSEEVEEEADTATATEAADSESAVNASDEAKTPAAEQTSPATTDIEDEEIAKAAAPVENQQSRFPWLVVVFAAIAGVSVEEYIRRKNAQGRSQGTINRH